MHAPPCLTRVAPRLPQPSAALPIIAPQSALTSLKKLSPRFLAGALLPFRSSQYVCRKLTLPQRAGDGNYGLELSVLWEY